jgi:hypothetical protein
MTHLRTIAMRGRAALGARNMAPLGRNVALASKRLVHCLSGFAFAWKNHGL